MYLSDGGPLRQSGRDLGGRRVEGLAVWPAAGHTADPSSRAVGTAPPDQLGSARMYPSKQLQRSRCRGGWSRQRGDSQWGIGTDMVGVGASA